MVPSPLVEGKRVILQVEGLRLVAFVACGLLTLQGFLQGLGFRVSLLRFRVLVDLLVSVELMRFMIYEV